MQESNRINFMIQRDGEAQARAWALQTYRIYRTGLYRNAEKTRWMRSKDFREKFLESLIILRRFLNDSRLQ